MNPHFPLALSLALALTAAPAFAQVSVPIHNNTVGVSTATGALDLLPARVRSYLAIANGSGGALNCTFDGTTAASGDGWPLATSATLVFETKVPRGAVRCYGASQGTIQIMEGF